MKLKKIVSAALALSMLAGTALIGVTAADSDTLPFTDVKSGKWYTSAVKDVYNEGIMQGKDADTFDPNAKITRAEVVTAFARIACTKLDGYGDEMTFTDTKSGKWYSDAVEWAADNGIIKGRGDGTFSPNAKITRAELASILVNFIGYMGINLPDDAKIEKFADAGTFKNWMKAPIEAVRKNGLMQGDDGMFKPNGNATRAEVAKVIANLLPNSGRVDVVENGKSDYVIVIDKENTAATDAAERMVWQIEETCGVTLEVVDDSAADAAKEIVIGETSRGKKIDSSDLGEDGYEIAVDGEKVYIDGETDDGVYRGTVNFMNTCTSGDDVRFTAKSADRDVWSYPIGKITINGNDISKYTVYYPANASANTMTGVNDLIVYIKKACGVELTAKEGTAEDHAIIIDTSNSEDLESFTVKTEGTNLIISGSDYHGAMYGCYDFLEECLGWMFMTGDIVSKGELVSEGIDWIRPADAIELKDVNYSKSTLFSIQRTLYSGTFLRSVDAKNKNKIGDTVSWTGGSCHTFDALDGEFSSQYENQPCLTNEKVYETMLANIMALLEKNPDARLISVSQNDNIKYCTCDKCLASYAKYTNDPDKPEEGGTAGNLIEFINRIAEEVEKKYPDVIIHTFAYTYTRHPPKDIVPRDNVAIQLCSIECCFNHSLDGTSDGCNADFAEDMAKWAEISKTLFIWDYNNNFAFRATPFPDFTYDVIAKNMRFFADNNVKYLMMQGNGSFENNGEFDKLRWYMISKLTWDPYMSEETYYGYMKSFMEGFYGEGWEFVYDALTTLCNGYDMHIGVYDSPSENWMSGPMYANVFKECVDLMTEAKLYAETKAEFERIDCSQIQFDYILLDSTFDINYNSSDASLKQKAVDDSKALQAKMQKYNVHYSDSYGVPELYDFTARPSEWKALMDVQMYGESE